MARKASGKQGEEAAGRSPTAKALRLPMLRQRIKPSGKVYRRKPRLKKPEDC